MKKTPRSYLSIGAAAYQLLTCLVPYLYYFPKDGTREYVHSPLLTQVIISLIFLMLLWRGYKWAYILFFSLQVIHLGSLLLFSGVKMYGYNFLLVALTGLGMSNRLAIKEEDARKSLERDG